MLLEPMLDELLVRDAIFFAQYAKTFGVGFLNFFLWFAWSDRSGILRRMLMPHHLNLGKRLYAAVEGSYRFESAISICPGAFQ